MITSEIVWYIIIYSVFGWIMEVSYFTFLRGKFVNRGMLNGPYCPIYGFGFTMILVLLNPIKDQILPLFFTSIILTSLLEYFTGFVLEKIFHEKWWDYSDKKFNIQGYICLENSLIWGVLCVLAIKIINIPFETMMPLLTSRVGIIVESFIVIIVTIDFISTVVGLSHLSTQKNARNVVTDLGKISQNIGSSISTSIIDFQNTKPKTQFAKYIQTRIAKAYPDLGKGISNE